MPVPESWCREHVDRVLHVEGGIPSGSLEGEFTSFLREKLLSGVRRLNEVIDRDPTFMLTNREPTVYKLGEYVERLGGAGADDEEILWIGFALETCLAGNDGWLRYGERLVRRDERHLSWVIAAGRRVYWHTGCDTVGPLRKALVRWQGDNSRLSNRLRALAEDCEPRLRTTAAMALDILDGGNPFQDLTPLRPQGRPEPESP